MANFLDLLDFTYPKPGKTRNMGIDVMLGVYGKDSDAYVSITFYNGIDRLIVGDGNRLVCAMFKNCVYFKASDKGFKLTDRNEKHKNSRIQFKPEKDLLEKYKNLIGEYRLKYDEDNKIYYIEKE